MINPVTEVAAFTRAALLRPVPRDATVLSGVVARRNRST